MFLTEMGYPYDESDTFDEFDKRCSEGDHTVMQREKDENMATHLTSESHAVPNQEIPEWVTTGEAKRILGVGSVNTIKRWIAEGKLKARRFDERGWIRVSGASVKKLIQQGDQELLSIRKLVKDLDETRDLDAKLSEDDLETLSDRRFGKLPWV